MGLRELAGDDFDAIVGDLDGFGWAITLTDPAGTPQSLTGLSSDISSTIDPDTGQLVSGRLAHVTLRFTDLTTIPTNTPDAAGAPWRVTFDDIKGASYEFKVRETIPDRAIGSIVLILEAYQP